MRTRHPLAGVLAVCGGVVVWIAVRAGPLRGPSPPGTSGATIVRTRAARDPPALRTPTRMPGPRVVQGTLAPGGDSPASPWMTGAARPHPSEASPALEAILEPVRVEFLVVDARTDRPLPGAEVDLVVRRLLCDEEGRCEAIFSRRHAFGPKASAHGYRPRRIFGVLPSGDSLEVRIRLQVEPGVVVLKVVEPGGRPIADALVSVRRGHKEAHSARTGRDGCIAVPIGAVPPFPYFHGEATAEGYVPARFGILAHGDDWDYRGAAHLPLLDAVVLHRPAALEGQVLSPDGQGVPDASVELTPYPWSEPSCTWASPVERTWSVRSDATGTFRFEGIPAGQILNLYAFSPAGSFGAEGVRFTEGENSRDCWLQRTVRVSGLLRDGNGASVAGIELRLHSGARHWVAHTVTDWNGTFAFDSLVWDSTVFGPRPDDAPDEPRGVAWGTYALHLASDDGLRSPGVSVRVRPVDREVRVEVQIVEGTPGGPTLVAR